jgi:hypothetical protein
VIVSLVVRVGPDSESVTVRVSEKRSKVPFTVLVTTVVTVIVPGVDCVTVCVVGGPVLVVRVVRVVVDDVKNPPPLSATTPTASAPKERTNTTNERMPLLKRSASYALHSVIWWNYTEYQRN